MLLLERFPGHRNGAPGLRLFPSFAGRRLERVMHPCAISRLSAPCQPGAVQNPTVAQTSVMASNGKGLRHVSSKLPASP
jgi:hypothetical protein